MHVLICSKRDLVANLMLNRILPQLAGHRVSLVLANRIRPFVATVPGLAALREAEELFPNQSLFPLLEASDGTAALLPFERLAARHGCILYDAQGWRRPARSELYRTLQPDVVLAIKYGFLFSAADLDLPTRGIFNLHSGPLPERPGLHALLRAMIAGEPEASFTVHRVTEEIDQGPIVATGKLALDYERSYFWNTVALYLGGADLLARVVATLAEGDPLPGQPQPAGAYPYLSLPGADELARFSAEGGRLCDTVDYLSVIRPYFSEARQQLLS